MIIKMEFDCGDTASLSLMTGTPSRKQFIKLAGRLWRNYVDMNGISENAEEKQTHFWLSCPSGHIGNKIGMIKALREITGLGLKEAKDVVEASSRSPQKVTPAWAD